MLIIFTMVNKFEAIGIFACICAMALALFLLRVDGSTNVLSTLEGNTQTASIVVAEDSSKQALSESLIKSMSSSGDLKNMIVDDVVLGEGPEVKPGDAISVHYIGTLQSGEQFDNSYLRGTPFTFTLGAGTVIEGWDEGLVGMKKGGQRILVIPPDLAYGNRVVGPIPANSNLVFSIELLEIK